MSNMCIKEKVETYGVDKLIPHESISFITGIDINSIKEYKTFDSIFNSIDEINCTELQRNKLVALYSICISNKKEKANRYTVSNPWDLYKYYVDEMSYLEQEVFKIVLLDRKRKIIKDINVFKGTLESSIVHPREIFKEAIRNNASSIILMHNHPSGELTPSNMDKNTTKRLVKCGEMMGIEILDHLILGDGSYFSFKENLLL